MLLGIDLGTTSVKVSLYDPSVHREQNQCCEVEQSQTRTTITKAYLDTGDTVRAEQDVNLIMLALERTLSEFSKEALSNVKQIGVCGQMHGCMLWQVKSERSSCFLWPASDKVCESVNKRLQNTSSLITWEDRRCTREFLASLPASKKCLPLSTGFGCASLFWFAKNDPDTLKRFDKAGTVQDFLVAMLCGLDSPVMSTHNATSWGYFDVDANTWETDLLKEAGFPMKFLPQVKEPSFIAGHLESEYYGIPAGVPVGVALGDFQCSVLASMSHSTDAVLNIGTSSQLAVVLPVPSSETAHREVEHEAKNSPTIQVLPFFKGKKVATSASLTGGNSVAAFVSMLQDWISSLGLEVPPEDLIYEKLRNCANSSIETSLEIVPTIWGERHAPESSGQVTGIRTENLTLGSVTSALYKGVLTNLQSMMSNEYLLRCGVQRIVGTGSMLTRNPVMQKLVEQVFNLPLVVRTSSVASIGALMVNERTGGQEQPSDSFF